MDTMNSFVEEVDSLQAQLKARDELIEQQRQEIQKMRSDQKTKATAVRSDEKHAAEIKDLEAVLDEKILALRAYQSLHEKLKQIFSDEKQRKVLDDLAKDCGVPELERESPETVPVLTFPSVV